MTDIRQILLALLYVDYHIYSETLMSGHGEQKILKILEEFEKNGGP